MAKCKALTRSAVKGLTSVKHYNRLRVASAMQSQNRPSALLACNNSNNSNNSKSNKAA